MAGGESQTLDMYCTAQKLSKINDFLLFAFAKKRSKTKKAKKQRSIGMSYYLTQPFEEVWKNQGRIPSSLFQHGSFRTYITAIVFVAVSQVR